MNHDDPAPPETTTVRIPLPNFLRPRLPEDDPDLPTVPSDRNPADSRPESTPPDAEPRTAPPPPSPERPDATRTATSATSKPAKLADPAQAAKVIGGLLVIVLGSAAVWLKRSGRELRMPTQRQRDDISTPLGNIAARYLPAELVSGTLVDLTQAAAATHAYVLDDAAPLITRTRQIFNEE